MEVAPTETIKKMQILHQTNILRKHSNVPLKEKGSNFNQNICKNMKPTKRNPLFTLSRRLAKYPYTLSQNL